MSDYQFIELSETGPSDTVHQSLKQPPASPSVPQQGQSFDDANAILLSPKYPNNGALGKAKIPRPANAFMLFANEWRKQLAVENPRESNKDISVRLGVLWKNMGKDAKEKYFALAREVDAEHKRKYPDYVYNPKEARLRKAMREQSREISRQSILQTTVASTIANKATNAYNTTNNATCSSNHGDNATVSESANHTKYPLAFAPPALPPATVSTLPNNAHRTSRVLNSWFPISHMPSTPINPIFSQRVVGCFQQSHQLRTSDKTKEVVKKQSECANAFFTAPGTITTCYSTDINAHGAGSQLTKETTAGVIEDEEYFGVDEFTDGRKWHPYRNTATAYQMCNELRPKISGRHGMQSVNVHSQGLWDQFPTVPLLSMTPLRSTMHEPRHMVFLQSQPERHGGISTDELPRSTVTNEANASQWLNCGYPQSYFRESQEGIGETAKWAIPTAISPAYSLKNFVTNTQYGSESGMQERRSEHEQIKCYEEDMISNHQRLSMKTRRSLPLPGFHQAFGSAEIGRFSRTEFFANTIDENNDVDSSNQMIPDGHLPASVFPISTSTDCLRDNIAIPEDYYWIAPNIGVTIPNVTDPNYVAYMDLSHRLNHIWTHSSSILPRDYPLIINDTIGSMKSKPLPVGEKEKTVTISIDSESCSIHDDNTCEKNNTINRKEIYPREIIQQDDNDDDNRSINVEEIDP